MSWMRGTVKSVSGRIVNVITAGGELVATLVQQWGFASNMPAESGVVILRRGNSVIIVASDGTKRAEFDLGSGHSVQYDNFGNSVHLKGESGIEIKAVGPVKITAAGGIDFGEGARAIIDSRIIALFNAHTHTSAAPGSPTSPPTVPIIAQACTTTTTKAA